MKLMILWFTFFGMWRDVLDELVIILTNDTDPRWVGICEREFFSCLVVAGIFYVLNKTVPGFFAAFDRALFSGTNLLLRSLARMVSLLKTPVSFY